MAAKIFSWIGGGILSMASLGFFALASAGFVIFMMKYPQGSAERLWGIRASHVFGFLGVFLRRLYEGSFTDALLLVVTSLLVSLLAFEIANRYLESG